MCLVDKKVQEQQGIFIFKFNLFLCDFFFLIYGMEFLIAIKYFYCYFIHHLCANCAHRLPHKHFMLVINGRD